MTSSAVASGIVMLMLSWKSHNSTIRVTVTSPTCQDFMCSRAIWLIPCPRPSLEGRGYEGLATCRLAAVGEGGAAGNAALLRPTPLQVFASQQAGKLHYPLPYQGERVKSRRPPLRLWLVARHAFGRQF